MSDKISKYKLFAGASIWMMVICVAYTNLSVIPFGLVVIFNILMMIGVMSRMIPSSALTSAVPDMADRGAFMSVNSSLQQIAGGIAAAVAGMIVTQPSKFAPLHNYNIIGYVVVCISIISMMMMYRVSELVRKKVAKAPEPVEEGEVVISEGF